MSSLKMMLIENHKLKDQTKRSKNIVKDGGQGSWPRGSMAKTSKKGGVRGGSQKSPNFAHGGGNLGGGLFWGGPGTWLHKT